MIPYILIFKPECETPPGFPLIHLYQDVIRPLFKVECDRILVGDQTSFKVFSVYHFTVTKDCCSIIASKERCCVSLYGANSMQYA